MTYPKPKPDQVTIELTACLKDGTRTEPHTHGEPGSLAAASEVVKASVKAQQKLEEDYARVYQAVLDSQAQLAYMQERGYMAPPRIYIAGIPEPGASFRSNEIIVSADPENTFCQHIPGRPTTFWADPLTARYAHGYQED